MFKNILVTNSLNHRITMKYFIKPDNGGLWLILVVINTSLNTYIFFSIYLFIYLFLYKNITFCKFKYTVYSLRLYYNL